ncbi:hypothetical protein AAY473_013011 [Plecturocebus cupreus]
MFVLDEADEMLSHGFKDLTCDMFQKLNSNIQEFKTSLGNMVKLCLQKLTRHGDTHLESQLLGRLRREDRLSPGASLVVEIKGVCHHTQLIFLFLVETAFHSVGQAGLELPTSSDWTASASQSAGITGNSVKHQKYCHGRGTVAHAYNPALWEAKAGGSPGVRSLRSAWPTWRNPINTKNTKTSQAWWCVSVIPGTQGAEAGESLELGGQRMQMKVLWGPKLILGSVSKKKNRAGHSGSCLLPQHFGRPGRQFGRPRQEDGLRSGVSDQPGQHGKTPYLLKIQKN